MLRAVSDRTRWDAITDGSIPLPANETLGFKLERADDPKKEVVFSWTVPAELCNTAGNVQGGVLAAFADAVLGAATAAFLPEDKYPALAEMKISIFRPSPKGTKLTGRGYIVKAGRRVMFAEAEITGPDGKVVAKATGTEIPADA
jgi:uncharacterized protein (TIGR00369 family)